MTYKIGDTVLYAAPSAYIVTSVSSNPRLSNTYYSIALPKRDFKPCVGEKALTLAAESLCDVDHILR